jgi:hypothetical protein
LCRILLPFLKYAFHLTITFHYCCTHLKFDIFPDFYRQNRGGSKLTRGSSQVNLTLIETETHTMFLQSFDKSFVLPILAMFIYMLRCQKIGLWRNFMWTFRFKNLKMECQNRTCKAAGISYSSVYRVVNGKSPPESNRPKERKLLMILTAARW